VLQEGIWIRMRFLEHAECCNRDGGGMNQNVNWPTAVNSGTRDAKVLSAKRDAAV
jgi:hypothetical protein